MPFFFGPKRRPVQPVDPAFAAAQARYRGLRDVSKDADDWHPVLYYLVAIMLLIAAVVACVVSMETAAISSENEKRILWGLATVSGATSFVMIAGKFFLSFVAAALPPGQSGFARIEAGSVAFVLLLLVCTQGLIGRSKIELTAQDGESRYTQMIEA